MRLRYAPRARSDIVRIYRYIAKRNAAAASAVVRQIRATSELLARYPGLGRHTDIVGIRVFPIALYPYLVYHTVAENEVTIVHVRDGRRDTPNEPNL